MDTELLIGGIGILTTIIGSWSSWFFAKRKYNAEVDSTRLDNLQKSLDLYQELVEDSKQQMHNVLEENKELRRELDQTREELNAARKVNADMQLQINLLNDRLGRLTENICTDLLCQIRLNGNIDNTLKVTPKLEQVSVEQVFKNSTSTKKVKK